MEKVTEASTQERKGMAGRIALAAGVIIVLLVAYAFLGQPVGNSLIVGEPAPDFSLSLFDGQQVSLTNVRGQVVVVNFWASWCPPCRQEAPDLERVWQEYKDRNVLFVGITHKDVEAKSQSFMEEFGITYANGADSRRTIAKSYGVTGVPETYVVGPDGTLAFIRIGPVPEAELAAALEELVQ